MRKGLSTVPESQRGEGVEALERDEERVKPGVAGPEGGG